MWVGLGGSWGWPGRRRAVVPSRLGPCSPVGGPGESSAAPSSSSTAASREPSALRLVDRADERAAQVDGGRPRLPAKARSDSSRRRRSPSTTSARAPTGAVQPASSAASSARSAATQARVSASSSGATAATTSARSARHSTASAPWPGGRQHLERVDDLGRPRRGGRGGPGRPGPGRRRRACRRATSRSRVSTLPRTGSTRRPRPSAASCAARRGEPVPTTEPAGSSPRVRPSRATSTSRGSSRAGIGGDDQPGLGRDRQVLERVHGEVDLDRRAAPAGWRRRRRRCRRSWSAARRRCRRTVVISTSSTRGRGARSRSATQPAWVVASALRRVPRRITRVSEATGRAPSAAWRRWGVGGRSTWCSCHGPVSGGTDTAATSCGSRSNRSRRACGVVVARSLAGELLDPDGRGVQQLLDDAVHGSWTSARVCSPRDGQPLVEPGHLGGDDVGGPGAQRGHGRGDGLRPAPGEVGGDLGGDQVLHGLQVRRGVRPRRPSPRRARPGRRPRHRAARPRPGRRRAAGPGRRRPARRRPGSPRRPQPPRR